LTFSPSAGSAVAAAAAAGAREDAASESVTSRACCNVNCESVYVMYMSTPTEATLPSERSVVPASAETEP